MCNVWPVAGREQEGQKLGCSYTYQLDPLVAHSAMVVVETFQAPQHCTLSQFSVKRNLPIVELFVTRLH